MNNLRKLALGCATLAAFVSFATLAGAQQQPQPITVTKIKDNVYWARGGAGSNDGIIVGKTGVIVVDTKTTVDSEKEVIAEIAKITPKTVNTAIITHSDGDHVNGLAAFPDGLTVIAQENCKKEMEASASSRNPAPQNRLPSKTYDKTDNLTIDGVHIRLYHWAAGHTSGDTVVYLPDQKIVFGGDLLVTNRPDTLIHLEKHGSAAGWIENAKGMVAPQCRHLLDRAWRHDDQGRRAEEARSSFRTSTTRSRLWSRKVSRSTKSRPPSASLLLRLHQTRMAIPQRLR